MLRLLRRTPAGCLMDVALLMCFNACGDATAQQDRIVTTFCGPNGLITSEDHLTAEGLPWEMTSGSLFRSNGTGWSGRPDPGDALGETGSAAFRTVSVDRDFLDVEMSVVLRVDDLAATPRIPRPELRRSTHLGALSVRQAVLRSQRRPARRQHCHQERNARTATPTAEHITI